MLQRRFQLKRWGTIGVKRIGVGIIKHLLKALLYGTCGGLTVLAVVFVLHLQSRPDLAVWHLADLDAEFTADTPATQFADYLAAEARVFEQVETRVYDRVPPAEGGRFNRYARGSLSDPGRWPVDWNRTFEFAAREPQAGVLLLHGMSDSPYSLRKIGQSLHGKGAWVVGLRLPGHGTAPAGLVDVRWEDMAAAVRLAMAHVKQRVGSRPVYMVGYSNGGALAIHYALLTLSDQGLPAVDGVVLISPAIGVTRLAALAPVQARLGHLLGLEKLAWTDILQEFDPFKYSSFSVNAGYQVRRLTQENQKLITAAGNTGKLTRLPPVLAFQSVVDATVRTSSLINGLFQKLPEGRHELILFDLNRRPAVERFLSIDPKADIDFLFRTGSLGFTLSLITNENPSSGRVVVRSRAVGGGPVSDAPVDLSWPDDLYSLSHVALPFPVDDPLYGGNPAEVGSGIHLGNLLLRGERGVLQLSAATMLRQRWNPFYPYLEKRLLAFVGLGGEGT
jgi:alpha-beta hydrolase superfamily lysophospholipase